MTDHLLPRGTDSPASPGPRGRDAGFADLGHGLGLRLHAAGMSPGRYPTDRIPKILTLEASGTDLSEEGVGFGVPVITHRRGTCFPGGFRLLGAERDLSRIELELDMSLAERVSVRGRDLFEGRIMGRVKEGCAAVHRGVPFLRPLLNGLSEQLRSLFSVSTIFRTVESMARIGMVYRLELRPRPRLHVAMRAQPGPSLRDFRIALMNEAGARNFDRYEDSSGLGLSGDELETWHHVTADRASLTDRLHGASFAVRQIPGADLYRGRELLGTRLSWAGLALVLARGETRFEYAIELGPLS